MRTLIAGNWKMNGRAADLAEAERIAEGAASRPDVDVLICPPATLIERMRRAAAPSLLVGAQDCHADPAGAHTGDLSAAMLADAGATVVIVGHSERRADHGETDATVRAKAEAALAAGLMAIVCVGETDEQRDSGQALDVVGRQLAGSAPNVDPQRIAVAYEPVWAIGTGRTPGNDDIVAMHAHIRGALEARFGPAGRNVRILYGGSLKPGNAAAILALPEVNGGLIGGASLKAADLLAIVAAAPER